MYQNYVVEIKKSAAGEFEHEVFWVYDEDADAARNKADAKFYEILSAAAVSEYAEHSAIIFTEEGFPLDHKCYKH